jgi:hypothetical protein
MICNHVGIAMVGEHVATCAFYSRMDFDNDEYLDFVARVNVPQSLEVKTFYLQKCCKHASTMLCT